MRISSAVVPLALLAACSQQSIDPGAMSNAIDNAQATAGGDERIECAEGAAALTRDCTVERTESVRGLILTVRRPDNGFHRLLVVSDGRGVIAADGAEAAKVTVIGDGRIEVAIGGDRFRLPATIKGKAASRAR